MFTLCNINITFFIPIFAASCPLTSATSCLWPVAPIIQHLAQVLSKQCWMETKTDLWRRCRAQASCLLDPCQMCPPPPHTQFFGILDMLGTCFSKVSLWFLYKQIMQKMEGFLPSFLSSFKLSQIMNLTAKCTVHATSLKKRIGNFKRKSKMH